MKAFTHSETDVRFLYEAMPDGETVLAPPPHGGTNMVYRHKLYVGDVVGQGWRHALVLGHVAYVIVDECEEDGRTWWVTEKWPIKRHIK